jgi:hypothetical protein
MTELTWAETVRQVHIRASFRCEYCQTAQRVIGQAMHVEHIIPNLSDHLDNLCLSCPSCNLSKAKAIQALDPETKDMISLFNPRTQIWDEHFEWHENGTIVNGKTATGRATLSRMKMNIERIVQARMIWVLAKVHPP